MEEDSGRKFFGNLIMVTVVTGQEISNMERINRDLSLQKLIDRKENGSIKVITGIRRY